MSDVKRWNISLNEYGEREAYEAWKLSMKPYGFDGFDAFQAGAAHQRQQAREVVMPSAEILADLFVGCPLPKTVRVDECALDPDYPHRFGTNLLTWGEARLMFGEMLACLNKGAGSHE